MIAKKGTKVSSTCGLVLVCLCLAAMGTSTSLNGMSPSLTQIARDFGFNDQERDLYLGGYVGIATMVGQLLGSFLSGMSADMFSRSWLLISCLLAVAIAMGCFSFPLLTFEMLLLLRVFMGASQGAAVPVIFSLIGDFYDAETRATVSAIVSSFLGGGMMIGQLFMGYCAPYFGWREPFFTLGLFSFSIAVFLSCFLHDPVRGGNEDALEEMIEKGLELPPMTWSSVIRSMMVPTSIFLILQTVPNTVPWGVLSTHLHDLLATDANLSVTQATSLIGIFGLGSAFGGIAGGILGAKLYAINRPYLPLFMGFTLSSAAFMLQWLLMVDLRQEASMETALPLLVTSGVLAAVNGANIRVVFLNLTPPESRGAAIAILNFVNCMGRGMGPSLIEMWMEYMKINRRAAISSVLYLWPLAGTLLCAASCTIVADENRLKTHLRSVANETIQNAASGIVTANKTTRKSVSGGVGDSINVIPLTSKETELLTLKSDSDHIL